MKSLKQETPVKNRRLDGYDDRVMMVSKICVLVLWRKVASALDVLKIIMALKH